MQNITAISQSDEGSTGTVCFGAGIEFTDATYLLTAPSCAAISSTTGITTSVMATTFGSIKCLIGGSVRYIPLYYNA